VAATVIPGEGEEGSQAVVNRRMIEDAEAALAECGGGNWLVVGRKRTSDVEHRTSNVEEEEERKRIEKAKADVEAGYDTGVDVGEKPEVVIEQGVERCAMIRMGEVERLRHYAELRKFEVPSGVDPAAGIYGPPMWAVGMARDEEWELLEKICDWVMKLRI
jgi:hypothetical protein